MNFINKNIKLIKIFAVAIFPIAAAAIIIYMKFFYVPGNGIACFTHKYFGLYCMGCGSTRQLYYALNGEFKTAFYYNVACVVIYPTYIYMYYLILQWALWDKKVSYRQAYVLAGSAIILFVYMVLRNLPFEIFDILRPLGKINDWAVIK